MQNLVYRQDDYISEDADLKTVEGFKEMAAGPSVLDEIRDLVREWYGNLPVEVLVLNKKLQVAIMEFESLCDRGKCGTY